jgi:hypothetical protein
MTAFICFLGIFQWKRVPMGIKGASAYFQCMMTTVVLVGLMYIFVESYLDDIIVDAPEENKFLANLRKVFERLRKYGVTLNPRKCRFGFPQVVYVGHQVDESGLTFSRDKLENVFNTRRPGTLAELRSFLGLAGYFREHIEDYVVMSRPLQLIVNQGSGLTKKSMATANILWEEESMRAFELMKVKINECPKLFFIREGDNFPVVINTDASNYGIGAYCYQTVDGVEQPIAFVSKLLTAEEIKWNVTEKECYAIVYTLRKLEYLLRDRKFLLKDGS